MALCGYKTEQGPRGVPIRISLLPQTMPSLYVFPNLSRVTSDVTKGGRNEHLIKATEQDSVHLDHMSTVLTDKEAKALAATREPEEHLSRCYVLGLESPACGPVMFSGPTLSVSNYAQEWPGWVRLAQSLNMDPGHEDAAIQDTAMVLILIGSCYRYLPDARDTNFGLPVSVLEVGDCEDSVLFVMGIARWLQQTQPSVGWDPVAITAQFSEGDRAGQPGGYHVLAGLKSQATGTIYPIDLACGRYPGRLPDMKLSEQPNKLFRRFLQLLATSARAVGAIGTFSEEDKKFKHVEGVYQMGQQPGYWIFGDDDKPAVGLNVWLDLLGDRPMSAYPPSTIKALAIAEKAWTKLLPAPFRTFTLQPAPVAPWQRLTIDTLAFTVWHRLSAPIRAELDPDYFILEVVSTQPDLPFTLIISRPEQAATGSRRTMATVTDPAPVTPAPVGFIPPPTGHVSTTKHGPSILSRLKTNVVDGVKDVAKAGEEVADDVVDAVDDVASAVDDAPVKKTRPKKPRAKKPAASAAAAASSVVAKAKGKVKARAEKALTNAETAVEGGALSAEKRVARGLVSATARAKRADKMLELSRGYQTQIANELDLPGQTSGRKTTKSRHGDADSYVFSFDRKGDTAARQTTKARKGGAPDVHFSFDLPGRSSRVTKWQHLSLGTKAGNTAARSRLEATHSRPKVTEWTPLFPEDDPRPNHKGTKKRKGRGRKGASPFGPVPSFV